MYKVRFKILDADPIEYESCASLSELYKTGFQLVRYAHKNHIKMRYIVSDMSGATLFRLYCMNSLTCGWIARMSGTGKYGRYSNGITYRQGPECTH